jgi:hypothetical protein
MLDVLVAMMIIIVFVAAARFWELGQIELERKGV